jgi:hypothetical protein
MNHQLIQLRTALALALALNRTLVLPRFLCGLETVTNFAHSGIRCRGARGCAMTLPYWCAPAAVRLLLLLCPFAPLHCTHPPPLDQRGRCTSTDTPPRCKCTYFKQPSFARWRVETTPL